MEFVPDGPNIPPEVLRAQEEGTLVLFCGAGVSMPAGLPDFAGLVDATYSALGATPTPQESAELQGKNYDRVLNSLQQRFGGPALRRAVRDILTPPATPDLATHRALVRLATDRQGDLRLVTTNFDLLFESAVPSVRFTAAPLLPVPKPYKWNRLVYLHGRFDNDDPDGKHLVLTSADFGTAYLVERWASRFVAELFNHCTVLFIGYRLSDPVMRYLVDAISAELPSDPNLHRAFILTSGEAGNPAPEDQWTSRGVTPIFYDPADEHRLLHQTLTEWAGLWSGGLISRLNVVTELAPKDPATLSQEQISRLCWAVDDQSGAAAREMAGLGKAARLAWLGPFSQHGLLSGPPGVEGGVRIALVDGGQSTRHVPPLDLVRRALAFWLASHLEDPDLLTWVITAGGQVHPELAEAIRFRLRDEHTIPPGLKTAWHALTGVVPLLRVVDDAQVAALLRRLKEEPWAAPLRAELLQVLAPYVQLRLPWSLQVPGLGDDATPRGETVRSVLAFDCSLQGGILLEEILDVLLGRPDREAILCSLALDVTYRLQEALDLHALLGYASEDSDTSYLEHPSIEPLDRNFDPDSWTILIELLRKILLAVSIREPALLQPLLASWRAMPYPAFHRLVLYAARTLNGMPLADVLKMVAERPQRWVWSVMSQGESLPSIVWLYGALSPEERQQLLRVILEGPPRSMFREDLDEQEWISSRDRMVWQRLARIRNAGLPLQEPAASRLSELENAHSDWRLQGEPREDLPVWTEVGWGLPSDYSPSDLAALTDDELVAILKEHASHREGLLRSAWPGVIQSDFARGLRILRRLQEEQYLGPDVWTPALESLVNIPESPEVQRDVLELLIDLPAPLLAAPNVVRSVVDVLKKVSETTREELRSTLVLAWDKTFRSTLTVEGNHTDDQLTDAINHPAGILTEALLSILRSRPLERNAGVPDDVRLRCERLLEDPSAAARLGRVVLASRLPLFFELDQEWTTRRLLPLFDWSRGTEAAGAWQGYLYSPWMRPSLWQLLKPHFLATCAHYAELGRPRENLAALLASVAIEGEGALAPSEASDCLRQVGADGRSRVVFWLWQRLQGAGQQASTLWRTKIGPWLASAWPRDIELQGQDVSIRLALGTTLCGEAFEEAVACISGLIGPVERTLSLLDDLEEKGHIQRAPESCLALVDKVTPDSPAPWFGPLGEFLRRLVGANPELEEDRRYIRLREAAHRSGTWQTGA